MLTIVINNPKKRFCDLKNGEFFAFVEEVEESGRPERVFLVNKLGDTVGFSLCGNFQSRLPLNRDEEVIVYDAVITLTPIRG